MVRDIRAHFGSQRELSLQAMEYLHGLANESRVREAIQAATQKGMASSTIANGWWSMATVLKTFPACYVATSLCDLPFWGTKMAPSCFGSIRSGGA